MIILIKVRQNRMIISRFNCGFDSIRRQMININMKFYLLLILFILFDVELLLVYRYIMCSSTGFVEVYLLRTILIIRYLYELNEGLLSWI